MIGQKSSNLVVSLSESRHYPQNLNFAHMMNRAPKFARVWARAPSWKPCYHRVLTKHTHSFQKRSPPHRGNGKWVPPPFGHTRTAEPPLSPWTAKPKIIPSPSDILPLSYFKWFNKSWQRRSDNQTSWTSVTSTSSQQHSDKPWCLSSTARFRS